MLIPESSGVWCQKGVVAWLRHMTATGCGSGFTKGAFSALADGTEPLAMVYPAHYVKSKIKLIISLFCINEIFGRGRVKQHNQHHNSSKESCYTSAGVMQQKPESAVFTTWLLRNKPFLIYQNSNMALRLGMIKLEKFIIHPSTSISFPLFYSPKPWS